MITEDGKEEPLMASERWVLVYSFPPVFPMQQCELCHRIAQQFSILPCVTNALLASLEILPLTSVGYRMDCGRVGKD